jgi:integrase
VENDNSVYANRVRENYISQSTRTVYTGAIVKFLKWSFVHRRHLVTEHFTHECTINDNALIDDKSIRQFLKTSVASQTLPLHFDFITASDILDFVISLRKPDGSRVGYSALNSHRSAINHLFRMFRQRIPAEARETMSVDFRGLKRMNAMEAADGKTELRQGKDPLPFEIYRMLARNIFAQPSKDCIFAHCFMVICWNLMCRSSNALQIRYEHMGWKEDALTVFFAHMKNDQLGERPRDPRAVYANPLMPEICPILALAVFFLCHEFQEGNNCLFPGSNQYDRFRKALKRVTAIAAIKTALAMHGINPDDLGTHSLRKGAATYCSSGSTAAPSVQAINLRAGWAMGGVQDTYYRYERAGDQYVGRTVAGLPCDSENFSILGPHFVDDNVAMEAVRLLFPRMPANLIRLGAFAAASFCYHAEHLSSITSSAHPLAHFLAVHQSSLSQWKMSVVCSLPGADSRLRATGIPPHVSLLRDSQQCIRMVEGLPETIISRMQTFLEENAVASGHITRQGLEAFLTAAQSTMEERITAIMTNSLPAQLFANGAPEVNRQLLSTYYIQMSQICLLLSS